MDIFVLLTNKIDTQEFLFYIISKNIARGFMISFFQWFQFYQKLLLGVQGGGELAAPAY